MSQKRSHKRRRYVVDRELQVATTIQLVSVMAVMGALYVVALFVLPGSGGDLPALAEMRAFLVRTTAVYFALAIGILGILTILVTHRIAGPAQVLVRALQGMRRGDYSHRLTLRKRDYLKVLAAEVDALREHIKSREEAVRDLVACVREDDFDAAREVATRLAAEPGEKPEPVATA